MRITVKRGDRYLIPKDKLAEASAKLSRFEDAEELEDVHAYCLQLERVAKLKQKKEPELASLLRRASDEIINMSNFRDSQASRLLEQRQKDEQAMLDYLDEIDGQLLDDPVFVIRQKVSEVFR